MRLESRTTCSQESSEKIIGIERLQDAIDKFNNMVSDDSIGETADLSFIVAQLQNLVGLSKGDVQLEAFTSSTGYMGNLDSEYQSTSSITESEKGHAFG